MTHRPSAWSVISRKLFPTSRWSIAPTTLFVRRIRSNSVPDTVAQVRGDWFIAGMTFENRCPGAVFREPQRTGRSQAMARSPDHADGATYAAYRDEFHQVLGPQFQLAALIKTNAHEGPVYVPAEHALYFTTVPEAGPKNIAIKLVKLVGEEFPFVAQAPETVQFPSNMANGMTLDREGHLVICEQGYKETPA